MRENKETKTEVKDEELLNHPWKDEVLFGISEIREESQDSRYITACDEIFKFVQSMPVRTRQDDNAHRKIMLMLSEIKHCLAHINVYGRPYEDDADTVIDEYTDKGIRIIENVDKLISAVILGTDIYPNANPIKEIRTDFDKSNTDWHYLSDGEYPNKNEDILICSSTGQVMEGFFIKSDSECLLPDGKWYRYRFRDMLETNQVVAWCYKPQLKSDKIDFPKNTKEHQLKKCIFLTEKEFKKVFTKVFGEHKEGENEVDVILDPYEGIYFCGISDKEVYEKLGRYFDVNITSIHMDDADTVGVWICYHPEYRLKPIEHAVLAQTSLKPTIRKGDS